MPKMQGFSTRKLQIEVNVLLTVYSVQIKLKMVNLPEVYAGL
jgi:hypothetical protein